LLTIADYLITLIREICLRILLKFFVKDEAIYLRISSTYVRRCKRQDVSCRPWKFALLSHTLEVKRNMLAL